MIEGIVIFIGAAIVTGMILGASLIRSDANTHKGVNKKR